jgi:iron complex outermembrane receptor protein
VGLRYNRMVAGGYEVSSSVNRRWVDRIGNDRTDTPTAVPLYYPAYALVNANVGLAKGPWSTTLWVQNLTNERALVSLSGQSDQVLGPRAIYTTPRTVGLNLSYRFE